jgi:hypothetical protein
MGTEKKSTESLKFEILPMKVRYSGECSNLYQGVIMVKGKKAKTYAKAGTDVA